MAEQVYHTISAISLILVTIYINTSHHYLS